jgi:hypothetical protein
MSPFYEKGIAILFFQYGKTEIDYLKSRDKKPGDAIDRIGHMNLLTPRGRQLARHLARYLVSVGLNFVELGSFAPQNSMRW